jgi:hypothetical protein
MRLHAFVSFAVAAVIAAGCGGKSGKTCVETGCGAGLVCEPVVGGAPACFDPISVSGRVYDLAIGDTSTNGLGDARVVGQDVNGAPVSSVAISGADGRYDFTVAAPRNADGSPASGSVTLRVDRAGYSPFPSGLRTALPIALTGATHGTGRWTVDGSLTDVGLEAIASPPAGEITGTVQLPSAGGVLVVAECGGVGYTAVPGSDGTYAIFNLPDGACDVVAYAKGVNYTPVHVTVAGAGTNPVTADLARSAVPTATVSGNVQFVSSTFWDFTSVLLVVDSTYDASRVRGIAPPGLEASGITKGGTWTITGIPDGHYRVLAAFRTDYVVRDPSDIGGTAVLEFQVANGVPLLMDGATAAASLQGFKITGAVRLTAPIADAAGVCSTSGAPQALPADPGALPVGGCTTTSAAPSFAWLSYASTDVYEVTVVDELGATVWQAQVEKGASAVTYGAAASPVSKTLVAAQALATGATYQVRVKAQTTNPQSGAITSTLSTSEDLLGVFTVVP